MPDRIETRWALAAEFDGTLRLLGRHCWTDTSPDELVIRTFRTRRLAEAAKPGCCYRKIAKAVRVAISMEIVSDA